MIQNFNYFGVKIHCTTLDETIAQLKYYDYSKVNFICFPDNYVISRSLTDDSLKFILNSSLMSLPDGKPTAMMGRRLGYKKIATVSGFWLCRELLNSKLTHFFLHPPTMFLHTGMTSL